MVGEGKRKVGIKRLSPKPSQIERNMDLNDALGGNSKIAQPEKSLVGRHDLERENNRSGKKTVYHANERDCNRKCRHRGSKKR